MDATTAAGPIFGDLPIQDAPYSISVIPAPLIDNLQATTPDDIGKVIPQITNYSNTQNFANAGYSTYYIRSFGIGLGINNTGGTYDGLLGGAGDIYEPVLEDKERVEVLSGVNGFLYGTGSVGGNINYVLKRPTDTPYYSVTAGDERWLGLFRQFSQFVRWNACRNN